MKNKIIYWTSTGIVAAMMLFSAFAYFTNADLKAVFVHLGFPGYFRIELAILKMLGSLALIIPAVPAKLKEYAYFGFGLIFNSAIIAHLSVGDPFSTTIMPQLLLIILTISYIFKNKVASSQRSLWP